MNGAGGRRQQHQDPRRSSSSTAVAAAAMSQMGRASNGNIPAGFDPSRCCRLYVANIHPKVTESHLIQVFQGSGHLERCKLIQKESCSNVYAFVDYKYPNSAALAIRSLYGKVIYGYAIKVNYVFASTHREDKPGKFDIFVHGFSSEVNNETLPAHFSAYPSCFGARVILDNNTGCSKGYGFVSFHDQKEAGTAITEMTDKWLGSRKIKCNWATRTNGLDLQVGQDVFTSRLLSLYESLKPSDEHRSKQRDLINSLQKIVRTKWPNAELHHYGSGANSFGSSQSDVDICLEIGIGNDSVAKVLEILAQVLRINKFCDVKEITGAKVPIVKMMDPKSGFSCDICINNLFAVANTKLLRDYAQIDARLLQLAFLVKHWAKLRDVNETYWHTLSSYAYVLMCINFLQLREPKILPCLQAMKPKTYRTVVDGTECTYFDEAHKLVKFGAKNKENIAQLLSAFFKYWAYDHDYKRDVISVRLGKIISKEQKNWTHVENDRHLICIEDPFETRHDLGRVVNKQTIGIIRKEFERAADILHHGDPDDTLFERKQPRSL